MLQNETKHRNPVRNWLKQLGNVLSHMTINSELKETVWFSQSHSVVTAGKYLSLGEEGAQSQVAGNQAPCKQWESMGRRRKAGTSRLTGNHIFWGNKCSGGRQGKVGKVNLQPRNMTCYDYALVIIKYNTLSYADKIYPSHHAPDTFNKS